MNDIERLGKVINALEDKATDVSEFSGVLSAVSDAKDKIESSQEFLEAVSGECKSFIIENKNNFDGLQKRLASMQTVLDELADAQARTSANITALDILTPEIFTKTLGQSERVVVDYLIEMDEKVKDVEMVRQKSMKKTNLLILLCSSVIIGVVLFFGLK
jgi:hypothetical protein